MSGSELYIEGHSNLIISPNHNSYKAYTKNIKTFFFKIINASFQFCCQIQNKNSNLKNILKRAMVWGGRNVISMIWYVI